MCKCVCARVCVKEKERVLCVCEWRKIQLHFWRFNSIDFQEIEKRIFLLPPSALGSNPIMAIFIWIYCSNNAHNLFCALWRHEMDDARVIFGHRLSPFVTFKSPNQNSFYLCIEAKASKVELGGIPGWIFFSFGFDFDFGVGVGVGVGKKIVRNVSIFFILEVILTSSPPSSSSCSRLFRTSAPNNWSDVGYWNIWPSHPWLVPISHRLGITSLMVTHLGGGKDFIGQLMAGNNKVRLSFLDC